jgi:hypothetical protein
MEDNYKDKLRGVTVLIADGEVDLQGDRFDLEYVKIHLLPIPVVLMPEYVMVGSADLRKEGNRVVADIEFFGFSAAFENMVPCVAGHIFERTAAYTGCDITRIDLGITNADSRVSKLGSKE